ncbi:hypothetical protein FX985_00947 [Pseudomonas extremaustralis]|uniref:Adhesin n=1 Tax=Pseudomonas extremaustralis TaxID=359110 RepID=A0A5M9IWH1_9PSED|nr:CS1 type fimbrial major subunit [Pseudomonas extremaustralis]KAA8560897.1 hypothetical protein FX985_00947 [Pseudomonas extremaustralis]
MSRSLCPYRPTRSYLRLRWRVIAWCVLSLPSFSAFAAREETEFHVTVSIPTSDFYVLPVDSGFLEREQVMHYNPVTERLSALRADFDVKNVLGGITARLGFVPTLFNGHDSISLNITFNGEALALADTLVVPENDARAGKRVPLVIAAQAPDDGFRAGQYFGSVQIIFDALRP